MFRSSTAQHPSHTTVESAPKDEKPTKTKPGRSENSEAGSSRQPRRSCLTRDSCPTTTATGQADRKRREDTRVLLNCRETRHLHTLITAPRNESTFYLRKCEVQSSQAPHNKFQDIKMITRSTIRQPSFKTARKITETNDKTKRTRLSEKTKKSQFRWLQFPRIFANNSVF